MRTILLDQLPVIELQETETKGKYFVAVGDKMQFDYQDGVFSQTYVPSKAMTELQKVAKERDEEIKTKIAELNKGIIKPKLVDGVIVQPTSEEEYNNAKIKEEIESVTKTNKQELAERLNEQQKIQERTFEYTILYGNDNNLSDRIDQLIQQTNPIYDSN